MNWWIISAVIFFLLSIVCGVSTALEIKSCKLDPKSVEYLGSIAFHAITAIIAIFLLIKGLK